MHRLAPGFFPDRDAPFNLFLPNTDESVSAKVCQDGSKALMTNPNDLLCRWLYRVIDRDFSDEVFNRPPDRDPYTYEDLTRIGVDSVMVTKIPETLNDFRISFCEIGSYDDFVDGFH